MNPSSEPSDPDSLALAGMRILVVDDSWQLGIAMTSLLQAFGAEVSGPVATAADARRLACEQAPDAALVDFNLRGGELAHDLIRRLHELGIHVVVTTGYTELPGITGPAVAVLHKPISETALLGSLRPLAARKAQGSSVVVPDA